MNATQMVVNKRKMRVFGFVFLLGMIGEFAKKKKKILSFVMILFVSIFIYKINDIINYSTIII